MIFKFNVRTPHRRPWLHLLKMYGYFFLGSLICMILGMGATLSTLTEIFEAAAITGAISLVGGIFVTATVRALFGLVQTGRLVQYLGFFLAAWGALQVTDYFVPVYLLADGAVAALVVVIFSFAGAITFGEVPVKGRTWLPVRRKAEARSSSPADSASGIGLGAPVRALRKDTIKPAGTDNSAGDASKPAQSDSEKGANQSGSPTNTDKKN